jgi:hypothetical protein
MSSFVGQPVGFENDSREDEFILTGFLRPKICQRGTRTVFDFSQKTLGSCIDCD